MRSHLTRHSFHKNEKGRVKNLSQTLINNKFKSLRS